MTHLRELLENDAHSVRLFALRALNQLLRQRTTSVLDYSLESPSAAQDVQDLIAALLALARSTAEQEERILCAECLGEVRAPCCNSHAQRPRWHLSDPVVGARSWVTDRGR